MRPPNNQCHLGALSLAGILCCFATSAVAESYLELVQALNHEGFYQAYQSPSGIGAIDSGTGFVTFLDLAEGKPIAQVNTDMEVLKILVSIDGSMAFVAGVRRDEEFNHVTHVQRWNPRLGTLVAEADLFPDFPDAMQLSEEAGVLLFTAAPINILTDLNLNIRETRTISDSVSIPALDGFRNQTLIAKAGTDSVWSFGPTPRVQTAPWNFGVSLYMPVPTGVYTFGGAFDSTYFWTGIGSFYIVKEWAWKIWAPASEQMVSSGGWASQSGDLPLSSMYFSDAVLSRNADFVRIKYGLNFEVVRTSDSAVLQIPAVGEFARDGTPVIIDSEYADIISWNLVNGERETLVELPGKGIQGSALSGNSVIMASRSKWPEITRVGQLETERGHFNVAGLDAPGGTSYLASNRAGRILKQSTASTLYFWDIETGDLLGQQQYTGSQSSGPDDGWTNDGEEFVSRMDYADRYPETPPLAISIFSANSLLNSNAEPTRVVNLGAGIPYFIEFTPTYSKGPILAVDTWENLVSFDSVTGDTLQTLPLSSLPGNPQLSDYGSAVILPLGTSEFLLTLRPGEWGPSRVYRGSIFDFGATTILSESTSHQTVSVTRDGAMILVMDEGAYKLKLFDATSSSILDEIAYPIMFADRWGGGRQQFLSDPFEFVDGNASALVCRIHSDPLRRDFVGDAILGSAEIPPTSLDENRDGTFDVGEMIAGRPR